MAYRKMIHIQTLEPLPGTSAQEALADYESDKAFVVSRYGPGGTNNPPAFSYEFNDTNKKITLTRIDTEWLQPE